MNRNSFLLVSISLLFGSIIPRSVFAHYPVDFNTPLEVIAFGSCNREDLPQDYWPAISANNPDLWIWDGDNIYGDSLDETVFTRKYDQQFNDPDYRKFRESVPIIGTWDDHDFGENNSGKWYTGKVMTQRLALDFLEEPKDSPRREQAGIYTSYTFGPVDRQVKIILIDNRYHADPPGEEANLLGKEQRKWLASELLSSKARINLIVSGTQVLPEDHPYEKWANFPQTRNWLFGFIKQNRIPGIIFLSGDRHIHEISLKNDARTAYPLVDITSSGMTHYFKTFSGEPNRYRVGDVYAGTGFGLIKIDWNARDPLISLQIRNMQNQVVKELCLNLSTLQPAHK